MLPTKRSLRPSPFEINDHNAGPAGRNDEFGSPAANGDRRGEIGLAGIALMQEDTDLAIKPAGNEIEATIVVPIDDIEGGAVANVERRLGAGRAGLQQRAGR